MHTLYIDKPEANLSNSVLSHNSLLRFHPLCSSSTENWFYPVQSLATVTPTSQKDMKLGCKYVIYKSFKQAHGGQVHADFQLLQNTLWAPYLSCTPLDITGFTANFSKSCIVKFVVSHFQFEHCGDASGTAPTKAYQYQS